MIRHLVQVVDKLASLAAMVSKALVGEFHSMLDWRTFLPAQFHYGSDSLGAPTATFNRLACMMRRVLHPPLAIAWMVSLKFEEVVQRALTAVHEWCHTHDKRCHFHSGRTWQADPHA